MNSRTPWSTPQPIEPSSHSPIPSDDADDEQEDSEDDEDDGERAECRDPPDLAGDRTGLGLGELDVRRDERFARIADRTDLVAQAGRGLTRAARRWRRRTIRRRRLRGRRRRGFGVRVRIVQGSAPGRFGRGGQVR